MKILCFSHKSRQVNRLPVVPAACLFLSILLFGCVTSNTVKTFNENREKYLLDEFDPSKLPSDLLSPIEKAFVDGRKFNKAIMEYDVMETNNGVVKQVTCSETEYGRDHGLNLNQTEFAANGISYRVNNAVQLLGLLDCDHQVVFLAQKNFVRSPQDHVLRKIDSIEPSPVLIKEGSSFTIKYRTGMRTQFMNFNRFSCKCTFGQRFSASQINPALQGDAMTCDVELSNDAGVVVSRSKNMYLVNYGMTYFVETSNSTTAQKYTLKSIRFE